MKKIFTSLVLLLSLTSFGQKGSILIFACCYEDDSITIIGKNKNFFQTMRIKTDFSTGLDKQLFYFDSSYFNSELIIKAKSKKKILKIPIKESDKLQYIYIWTDQGFDFRVYDKPLKVE